MRALLQKDLCVLWRQMKVFFLLVLVFSLTPSNFQEVFAVVYVAMIPYTIFAQDEASKWNDLASMLPYSTRDIVGSKYLLGGLSIVLSMVFSTLARCVWALAASRPMEPGITLTAGCGAVLIMDLSLPLLFRFGAEKGRMMMVLMVALVCGGAGALSGFVEEGFRMGNGLLPLAAAAAAATVVSIGVSARMWERRKN